MGRPTLKHRDLLRGSIRCFLATAAGALFFLIMEESTRLATSFPFSKRPDGNEPSRVGLLLLPTRAPLLKMSTGSAGPPSCSRALTHVYRAASVPVEQEGEPTRPDGPVVTPRPPVRSTGRYSSKYTGLSHLSSSRSCSEPRAPPGAVGAASCGFFAKE